MIKDKKSYNILLIEDNNGDFAIVEQLLEQQISQPVIVHAGNFKQAKKILTTDKSLFDVILLDLTLPDKSGQNLITEILQCAPDSPIVILTGYSEIDFSINSISLGISDYLIKDDLSDIELYKSIIYAIERKKIITTLKESEKRYSDLFHLSPIPMWLYESESLRFLDVNNAAIRHYGYSREEFLAMTIIDIRLVEEVKHLKDTLLKIKQENLVFSHGIYKHLKKSGEIIQVEIQSNSIQLKGQEVKLVLANDITERLKYLKAVENQNEKLREIAWIQSHIVRAPLARMMGIVNLIKELKIGSPELLLLLKSFTESGEELDIIIKDIVKKAENIS